MRTCYLVTTIFVILSSSTFSQDYFPLEIGNRWDYLVWVKNPGIPGFYDTLSVEIIDQRVLPNGMEYFEFLTSLPFWPLTQPRFIREENDYFFYYDESDSSDCFAFRFDLPEDTFYYNCRNMVMNVWTIESMNIFGQYNLHQHQLGDFIYYIFSENFGIYEYWDDFDLVRSYYYLKGCIISGVAYGNLLVSAEGSRNLVMNYILFQNYPNPFNPSTKIEFHIADFGFVSLKVYDLLGSEVATLVNEEKPAGEYEVEFDGNKLPSGIYFYQLIAGDFVEAKKMILLK
jgi:hypothetical protein